MGIALASICVVETASVIKVGVVDVDVRALSHLKEELACAAGKQLRVISTIMLFKTQLYIVLRS